MTRRTRRDIVMGGVALSLAPILGSIRIRTATAAGPSLAPSPACEDNHADATEAETAGPYFKPGSPERFSLIEPGLPGTRLILVGLVLSTACRPVARALLDFWHADTEGEYDNVGNRLRGHQFTDENGVFRLETIVPGVYPGRTRHIHVKVQAPDNPVLTTQLYFPNEPRNRSDFLFRPDLLMRTGDDGAGRFDFVLNIG